MPPVSVLVRDGFMLSIADKLGAPIGRVRIITECSVLVLGLIIGE